MVLAWKDKKVVRMISTRHTDVTEEVPRWKRIGQVMDGRRRKTSHKVCICVYVCCGDATMEILLPICSLAQNAIFM